MFSPTLVTTFLLAFNNPQNPASTVTSSNINTRIIDVAVIGTGFAGLAAAIEAGQNLHSSDSKVVIFEKMSEPGGNSVYNAGQMAAVGSKYQAKAGIEDSVQLFMDDMMKAGVHLNHPNLLRKMIERSNDVVQWTENDLGTQYRDRVTQMGGHSVARSLSTMNSSGRDIIDPMLHKVNNMENVDIELNTGFQGYVFDEKVGGEKKILGIKVRNSDTQKEETILCRRGVVLAAGGFGADVKFRSIQNPSFDSSVMTTNHPGATAEVLKETLKLGSMPVQLSHIQLGPWTSPDEPLFGKAPFFCLGAGFPYGIIVDPNTSQRFVNELGNRYERSNAIIDMGHPVVCLTDADGAKHSLIKDLSQLEPAVKHYETIEDLAQSYKMDETILRKTIDEYNEGVAKGQDKFGKSLRDDLNPITKPPYYATRLWPKVHFCCGGIQINDQAQVMHIDDYPIKGLYAAGEVTGGIHGGDRLGSCSTLDCLAFGRIAGESVASVVPIQFAATGTTPAKASNTNKETVPFEYAELAP